MPHRTQMALIKRRLSGKEGTERLRELRSILEDLPDYRNGPYADIRKWVTDQIDSTRARARVVQRDSIAVRREGAAQAALVGPPNAGKSSLLHALSEVQVKIGDYAFTRLRPVPALVRIGGVLVQFIEIPGLIQGAAEDRGGGRALLGVLGGAGVIVFCLDAGADPAALTVVRREVEAAGIERPAFLAATKMDEAPPGALADLRSRFADLEVIAVSIIDDDCLEVLKQAIWRRTGLLRVYLRRQGRIEPEPVALPLGGTALDAARSIHNELAAAFRGARIWGSSARFAGQRVGREHVVAEGDVVEVLH